MAKVLVSFDDTLLKRIDRLAEASGQSRSAYLSELAVRDAGAMGRRNAARARTALSSLDRLFADSPPGESTTAVRAMRDAR